MNSIDKLLQNNFVSSSNQFYTHVSMRTPKGKYQFNRDDLEKFWKLWCKNLSNKDKSYGLAERPHTYLPILVDIDIKVKETKKNKDKKQVYTSTHIENVIDIYQSVLRKMVKDCNEEMLTCLLLEKPLYKEEKNNKKYIKNGFHLHFPYIFLSKINQQIYIIPEVKKNLKEMNVFDDLKDEEDETLGAILDDCTKKNWLLYGSKKEDKNGVKMGTYKVTCAYNSEGEKITLEEALENYKIYDKNEQEIDIKGHIKYYLPRILSIIPYNRKIHEIKPGIDVPLKNNIPKLQKNKLYNNKIPVEDALKEASSLLDIIKDWRADDYNEWMIIGWALYNIGEGSDEALNLWLKFSQRCEDKYDEAKCIYEWEKMVKKDISLGTLKYYANLDNPELYKEFIKTKSDEHIKESLNGSHNDIAKALYALYGSEFVCASFSSTKSIWFQYKNHHWTEIENGIFLRNKLSDEIVNRYVVMGKDLLDKIAKVDDEGEKAMYNTRLKKVQKIIQSLKQAPFKTNVMKECSEVFYDDRFLNKLDKNPFIFAFKNGVYDLKNNIFRDGRPEDFISKTAPINYIEMNEDYEAVQNVYDFLDKVFPDKSIRQYFLDVSCSVFEGGNPSKKVPFWVGDGDNAKSVTQLFFEKMLGPYAIKIPTTVITSKKPPTGTAIPELARAGNGVRWATLEEPDENETINIGIFKHLSGNDSFFVRGLYNAGGEITPMFKLIFICNKLPKVNFSDQAFWNRTRVILFESTFCNDAPKTPQEQIIAKRFPIDPHFSKKIPDMVEAFAWVLLNHRKNLTNIIEPEKVKVATAKYRRANDILRQFIEEFITEDNNKNVCITLTELYATFKLWFKESLPNHSIPIKNEVKEYFIKLWGDPEPGFKWHGYRLRTLQDEIQSGDAIEMSPEDFIDYQEDDNKNNLPPI